MNPNVLFDNNIRVFSTCRDCKGIMQVTTPDEHSHPTCAERMTKLESLARGWLSCIEAGDGKAAALTRNEIDKRTGKPPRMKAAALQYISWGWPVFPLREGTKEPATRHGFKDATTDFERVSSWWERHPRDNIAVPTGLTFDVLDVDPANDGLPSFLELLAAQRIPDAHGVVVTSSGGMHFYLEPTGKGNRAGFMPGLDYRGRGGYVVAPPSTLGEVRRSWSWMAAPSPTIKT